MQLVIHTPGPRRKTYPNPQGLEHAFGLGGAVTQGALSVRTLEGFGKVLSSVTGYFRVLRFYICFLLVLQEAGKACFDRLRSHQK